MNFKRSLLYPIDVECTEGLYLTEIEHDDLNQYVIPHLDCLVTAVIVHVPVDVSRVDVSFDLLDPFFSIHRNVYNVSTAQIYNILPLLACHLGKSSCSNIRFVLSGSYYAYVVRTVPYEIRCMRSFTCYVWRLGVDDDLISREFQFDLGEPWTIPLRITAPKRIFSTFHIEYEIQEYDCGFRESDFVVYSGGRVHHLIGGRDLSMVNVESHYGDDRSLLAFPLRDHSDAVIVVSGLEINGRLADNRIDYYDEFVYDGVDSYDEKSIMDASWSDDDFWDEYSEDDAWDDYPGAPVDDCLLDDEKYPEYESDDDPSLF
jgi:hypothetical protein